jgi:hypothetical protein
LEGKNEDFVVVWRRRNWTDAETETVANFELLFAFYARLINEGAVGGLEVKLK